MARVSQAIEDCRREHLLCAEAVIQRTHSLAAREKMPVPSRPWTVELITIPNIEVPPPDLSCFNQLLDNGRDGDVLDNDAFVVTAAEAPCKRPVTTFFT
jgi:hypothetical protein